MSNYEKIKAHDAECSCGLLFLGDDCFLGEIYGPDKLNSAEPCDPVPDRETQKRYQKLIVTATNAIVEAAGTNDPVEFARQLPARLAAAQKLGEHVAAMTEREKELTEALRIAHEALAVVFHPAQVQQ